LSRPFAEDQTDEEGTALRGEVEDHALLLPEAERPAELGAGVIPEFEKGPTGQVSVLKQGTPELGSRAKGLTQFVR